MSIDAAARARLRDRLDEVLGPAEAATLMSSLSGPDTSPLTGADLDERLGAVGDQLRGEMATLGDQLRGEMATLGDQLRGEMASMHHELVAVFRGELMAAVTSQTRTIVYANLGLVLGSVSVALAAGRLFG